MPGANDVLLTDTRAQIARLEDKFDDLRDRVTALETIAEQAVQQMQALAEGGGDAGAGVPSEERILSTVERLWDMRDRFHKLAQEKQQQIDTGANGEAKAQRATPASTPPPALTDESQGAA